MNIFWNIAGYPILCLVSGYAIYSMIVKPAMTSAAVAMNKSEVVASKSGFEKFIAKLDGWKTHICLAVIGGVQVIPDVLYGILSNIDLNLIKEFQALPWSIYFTQDVANKITGAAVFVGFCAHAVGYAKAANTVPPKD